MMLDETKSTLTELVIELHDQARKMTDPDRSLQIRKVADEISDLIKERDSNALS